MDINPFDQFAGEFNAALPPTGGQPGGPAPSQIGTTDQSVVSNAAMPTQFNLAPQPTSTTTTMAPKPIMNNGYPQPVVMGQPYGQPSTMQQQQQPGMMNQQQQQQPPPNMNMQQGMMTMHPGGFNNSATTHVPFDASQGGGGALVPSNVPSNPYSLGPPYTAASGGGSVVPMNSGGSVVPSGGGLGGSVVPPMGGQSMMMNPPSSYGQPPQLSQPTNQNQLNPFDAAPAPPPQQQQQTQMNPYQQPSSRSIVMDPFAAPPQQQQQQQMVATDPWSSGGGNVVVPPSSQQPPQIASDPWGGTTAAPPPPQQQLSALVPSNAANDDPFGIFGTGAGVAQPPVPQPALNQSMQSTAGPPPNGNQTDVDPWAEMGFGSPAPTQQQQQQPSLFDEGDLFDGGIGAAATRAQNEANQQNQTTSHESHPPKSSSSSHKKSTKKGELPPGGEWYDAKIFTPTLGVMFFKPKELVDSLFLQTDKSTVEALEDRPVVAFIVEGSSARSAGVELGHVLLKVNGIDVKNPKEASRLIKEGPRPLPLLFYVPDTKIVVAEGEHMVKYNTKETSAPNSAKDWKPKYVVIGGIIAQPWMMNMYRSKSEYDIAVIETQARRPISVKVKQFSLQGARIQNDWQGPQMVKYKNKLHPWKYIVILPVSRNPIKIASPNLSQLKPVHEGIRRVLNAQQSRSGGGGHHSAQPVRRDEYDGRGGGGYNGRGGY